MATADDDVVQKAPAEVKREPKINVLFRTVMKHEGSDLHLKVGLPPMMRLKGVIRRMELPPISSEQMDRLFFEIMSPRQRETLDETGGGGLHPAVGQGRGRCACGQPRQRGQPRLVAPRRNNH